MAAKETDLKGVTLEELRAGVKLPELHEELDPDGVLGAHKAKDPPSRVNHLHPLPLSLDSD